MKKILRIIKLAITTIVVVSTLFSAFLLMSGNTYVFFLMKNTVLKGRLGPSIDEYEIFENRIVNVGQATEWTYAKNYNIAKLNSGDLKYHEKYGTAAYVVIKDDAVLFQQYWNSYSDSSHTNSWSMAKSIVSHLIGCALKDSLIGSVDDSIGKYLKEYEGSTTTIENLLTMSSGFNYDEDYMNPFSYPARSLYGDNIVQIHKRYKQVRAPGESFDYQSANTQLLGFILMQVTGKKLSEYASEKLWRPIGARHPAYWSVDHKNGTEKAFCCFNSNALDFAKFGQLYLHEGIVNGDTLITPEYYQRCISPAIYLSDGDGVNMRYGFQWWTLNLEDEAVFYARGIQGQYIFVIPSKNMVVVRLGKSRPTIRIDGHPEDVYRYIKQAFEIAEISS